MISIIICSRFQSISKELKDNIENTVGVVHEIICIDNSKSQYDIFSAYNEGVKRSQYPLLCFMHADILHWIPVYTVRPDFPANQSYLFA